MDNTQQAARDRAVKVLTHYITLLLKRAEPGRVKDPDVDIEVAGIVDDIILAATLPTMSAHEAAVADLRRAFLDPGFEDRLSAIRREHLSTDPRRI